MIFKQNFLPKMSIKDIDALFQNYLDILYKKVEQQKISTMSVQENIDETYGEILYPSIDKLISVIELTQQDVFVDLGSGKGQIVIHFFLKSIIKAAYGIEVLPGLHTDAISAMKIVQKDLPLFFNNRQLTFFSGSFLELPFETATIVLINSTCFTQSLLNRLGVIIENTPNIHTVLSLRPISTLQRIHCKKTIRIECSWDSALCYLYTSKNS